MTRLINTVLITVVAFFVFLGVFWQFAGGGTGAGPRGAPTVTALSPQWQGSPPHILVGMTVHNPAADPARPSALSYEATVDGQVVDHAVGKPLTDAPIPPKGDGPVQFMVTLPTGFAVSWWTAYMQHAETSDVRIHGTVSLRRADGPHEAPFEWRSSWTGTLAKDLGNAAANCEPNATDVCLSGAQFSWKSGALHADLVLRNPGAKPVALGNATVGLDFGGHAVVAGRVDLAQSVPAGGSATVPLTLAFSQPAIAAWWPEHAARCERTPVAFALDLQARSLANGTGVTTLQWTFPSADLDTRFVCA